MTKVNFEQSNKEMELGAIENSSAQALEDYKKLNDLCDAILEKISKKIKRKQ